MESSFLAKVALYAVFAVISTCIVSPSFANTAATARRIYELNLVKPNFTVDALSDGTIQFKEANSVLWRLSTGPSLRYSCRDEKSKFDYIDCGDNGELYWNTKDGAAQRLSSTIEQFISHTPYIMDNMGVLHGSRKTTVFLVDANSGKLVHTYESEPSYMERMKDVEVEVEAERPFYVTRRDYSLELMAGPDSSNVLWKMTLARIEAAFVCPPHLELDSYLGMQFPKCHSDVHVYHSYKPSTISLEGCDESVKTT